MNIVITEENFKDIKGGDILEFPHNGKRVRISNAPRLTNPINKSYLQYTGVDRYEVFIAYDVALGCVIIKEKPKHDFTKDTFLNRMLDTLYYQNIGMLLCSGMINFNRSSGDNEVIKNGFVKLLRESAKQYGSIKVDSYDEISEQYLKYKKKFEKSLWEIKDERH